MPDIVEFDSGALNSLMFSVLGLGVLLVVGALLRMAVPLIRRLYLPAALLGGVVGLLCGQYFLGIVPAEMSATWSSLAGVLIAVVFAPMLLGTRIPSPGEAFKEAGPQIWMSWFSSFVQVAIPALLVVFLLGPVFGTDPMFSTIFEASWSGGHGTAAGMDVTWTGLGWADGSSLALFSATISLVYGVIMGTFILNIAARRGHLSTPSSSTQDVGSDILETPDGGQTTTSRLNTSSLSNLAFHSSLIAIAILLGYGLKYLVDQVMAGVPLFPLAMIGGVVVQLVIRRTRLYELVDKPTLNSIAGVALDFLVVSAIASLSVPVMLANWAPLTIVIVALAVTSVVLYHVVGPRVFHKDWAENSIAQFGTQTGVVAIGLMLLRVADPQMRTNAYRTFALRSPFVSPFIGGGLVTAAFPLIVVQYGNLWLGLGATALCVAMIGLARVLGIWRAPVRRVADRVEVSSG
ncbi:glutamate:Na+ symporter, ESS family [Pseudonocardia ammonioxydans]|uniref:Glutamate:Na+ symporter, ESS family n=1 Tax=Pseudonocardia ammonioxydans TaxID=260086 RepID=A0A1I4YL14_PSUAM|nr:sodium/glutamate symporter [Pseudonocardia ammonioxydans]SFN38706.1 glutamate:Na+ symporter, ESS family [Pseudonocardia ammonioxydans]